MGTIFCIETISSCVGQIPTEINSILYTIKKAKIQDIVFLLGTTKFEITCNYPIT